MSCSASSTWERARGRSTGEPPAWRRSCPPLSRSDSPQGSGQLSAIGAELRQRPWWEGVPAALGDPPQRPETPVPHLRPPCVGNDARAMMPLSKPPALFVMESEASNQRKQLGDPESSRGVHASALRKPEAARRVPTL